MLISLCIPCHNRTFDLKKTLPSTIDAINASPPVEIVIVDYNSKDDLQDYLETAAGKFKLKRGNTIKVKRFTGREHYHMAHARNLTVLASKGDYVVISSCDITYKKNYFVQIRKAVEEGNLVPTIPKALQGLLVVKRSDIIEAGGYDERFEFYGPEDKELYERLQRRGVKFVPYPLELVNPIRTPDKEKVKNYRLKMEKREMSARMKVFYEENQENKILVANVGRTWGSWT